MDELTRQVMVRMPEDLHDALERVSTEEGRTVSQTIRLAIRRYLETRRTVPEVTR